MLGMHEGEAYLKARSLRQVVGGALIHAGERLKGNQLEPEIKPQKPEKSQKPIKYKPPKSKENPEGTPFEQAAFVIERDFAIAEAVLGVHADKYRWFLRKRLSSQIAKVAHSVLGYGGDTGTQYNLSKETRDNWVKNSFTPHRSSDINDANAIMREGEIDAAAHSTATILLLNPDFHPQYKNAVLTYLTSNNQNLNAISRTLNSEDVEGLRKKMSEDPRIVRHRESLAGLCGTPAIVTTVFSTE